MPVNQPKQYSASHNAALHRITVPTSLNSDGNVSKVGPKDWPEEGIESLQASKLIHMQLTEFNDLWRPVQQSPCFSYIREMHPIYTSCAK